MHTWGASVCNPRTAQHLSVFAGKAGRGVCDGRAIHAWAIQPCAAAENAQGSPTGAVDEDCKDCQAEHAARALSGPRLSVGASTEHFMKQMMVRSRLSTTHAQSLGDMLPRPSTCVCFQSLMLKDFLRLSAQRSASITDCYGAAAGQQVAAMIVPSKCRCWCFWGIWQDVPSSSSPPPRGRRLSSSSLLPRTR